MIHRNSLARACAGIIAVLAAAPLAAQPYLVKNIDDSASGFFAPSSFPKILGTAGDLVVFTADDRVHGREPWATDGSVEGTALLVDLAPGPGSSTAIPLGSVGSRLVFLTTYADPASPERAIRQVWATDGKPSGTVLLLPVLLASAAPFESGRPFGIVADPPRLFFLLRTVQGEEELWATDGTAAGTRFVALLPTTSPIPSADVGGDLVFVVDSGTLWRSDGTRSGTGPVRSFALIEDLVSIGGGRAILVALDQASGREPWVTDGTPVGTHLVADLVAGESSSQPRDLISDGTSGEAFFVALGPGPEATFRLWRTDGTAAGTVRLTTEAPSLVGAQVARGLLYTGLGDAATGFELLVSDGTLAGTRVLDLCSGPCSSAPSGLAATSVGVVFTAFDVAHGREPWVTDGTKAGTERLADLCPEVCSTVTERLVDLGGSVLGFTSGVLWVTDGTPAGTGSVGARFDASQVAVANGVAVTSSTGGLLSNEPWRTDGTAAGTFALGDVAVDGDADSHPAGFALLGDELFFAAGVGSVRGLWRSDGTSAGTRRVVDFSDLTSTGEGKDLAASLPVGSDLFYLVKTPAHATELWRTDGTAGGSVRLLARGSVPERGSGLAAVGDQVYLLGPGLWTSGRSPGSVRQLAELVFQEPSGKVEHGVLDGRLIFAATVEPLGDRLDLEPWATDGTAAGTRRVRDLRPGAAGSRPHGFTPFAGALYFLAAHDRFREGLWRTDGTEGGTERLFEYESSGAVGSRMLGEVGGRLVFFDGAMLHATDGDEVEGLAALPPDSIGDPVELGGRLYFVLGSDTLATSELWSTDGTPAGTVRAAGLLPPGHRVARLWAGGDRLVLDVSSRFSGQELWATDGTAAGSHRIANLSGLVLDAGSNGVSLAVVGGQVLFAASSRDFGNELWGADLDARRPPFGPPAAPAGLEAESVGESSVLLSWRDESGDETSFRVSGEAFQEELGGTVEVPAGTMSIVVHGLPSGVPFTFTVAAVNAMGLSPESDEASATPLPGGPEPCVANAETLCLLGGRFGVSVRWRDQHNGGTGVGGALPLPGANRTGRFWFFDPDNVELIVKALDGRPVTGAFWSFYGALSDVEYWVTVVDAVTGRSRTYHNRPGEICGVPDTGAFPEAPGLAAREREARVGDALEIDWPATASTAARPRLRSFALPGSSSASLQGPATPREGTCAPNPQTLCLLGDRLRVEVAWHDQHNGGSGTGQAVPGSDKTGYFWFFNADNLELVVKALDGTGVNGHLWLFYGALSDVEYTITVTDTVTQAVRSYHNPPGEFCGRGDTAAF